MTTQRQKAVSGDTAPSLRGAHMHLHVTTSTRDTTTLRNTVLRGEFITPAGRTVSLKAGPRVALYALLSYGMEGADDPTWRLDMDHFTADFVEKKTTVYSWIRTLEGTGFVVRARRNDPHTGQFEWHLDVADRPGVLPGTQTKPQVTPSAQKGGGGAAPPVDNSETPCSDHPHKNPGWVKPIMGNPAHGDLYRETLTKELPASPPVPATRETAEEVEAAPRDDQPSLSLVRPVVPAASDTELAAEPDWVDWVNGLLDHPAVLAANPLRPTRRDLELIAVRAQVAVDQDWTRDQLAKRVLLVRLAGVEHLGSVWANRLHPERLTQPPAQGQKTQVEQGQRVPDAMVPDANRRAQIRQLHGLNRGATWEQRMGGTR